MLMKQHLSEFNWDDATILNRLFDLFLGTVGKTFISSHSGFPFKEL